MSIKAIVWAFRQKCGTPAEKLVLLALADQANDTGECWPGHEYLAEKCDLTRETICRLLRSLEKQKKISSQRRKDRSGRDVGKSYILQFTPPGVMVTLPGVMVTLPGVINNHIRGDKKSHEGYQDVTSHIRCGTVIEPSVKQKPGDCYNFNPDRITSDTPLPPLLQAEWDKFVEIYPKPRGIIKGRDRAVRMFCKSAERARILRNAGHYSCSADAKSGFVMGLDEFVVGGYRDYDFGEQPLGQTSGARGQPGGDFSEQDRDRERATEFDAKAATGEISLRPRERLPFELQEEYERKLAEGKVPMVRV
mgnify:CR=1 FL=1